MSYPQGNNNVYGGPAPHYYCDQLTPDEVAKMAQAGVRIEWDQISHRVNPLRDKQQDGRLFDVRPDGMVDVDSNRALMKQLAFRMKWPEKINDGSFVARAIEFDFIKAHRAGDKVYIFVVRKGDPVTLTDEWALFPSDALVTQLRVLGDAP